MRVARQTKQRIQSVLKQETVLRQGGVWAEDHKWAGWTAVCQINSRFCIHPQESHFVGSCSRPSVWPAVTTWFFSALNPSSDSWIDRKNAMQRTLRKKRACLPVWRFCLGSVNIWTGQAIWKHPKAHELSQTFTLSLKYIAPAARFNKAPSWVWWHVMAASALWTTLRRVPNLLCCTWEVCSCCAKLGAASFSVDSRVWTGSEDVNTKENNVTLRLHSGR